MRLSRKNTKTNGKKTRTAIIGVLFVFALGLVIGVYSKEFLKQIKSNLQFLASSDIFSAFLEENNLPTLEYHISFQNFSKISQTREKAMNEGILRSEDDDFVSARIAVSNKSKPLECKVRLKGDLAWHWSGSKWSLRTEIKKGKTILGKSRFSIQAPGTRHSTYEWLYLETLRKEGVVAPKYEFCNVIINGKKMGIYAIEEHFSKYLTEGQKRREGLVLAFDEYAQWNCHWNLDWQNSYRTSQINIRNESRVNASEVLKKQKNTALHLLRGFQDRSLTGSQVFDVQILGKFLAISHIWGAEHGFSFADINFYFNPVSAKLEPVGMDAKPNPNASKWVSYFNMEELNESWVNYALASPKVAYEYVKHLETFSSLKYLDNLHADLAEQELKIRNLLVKDLFFEDRHTIWNDKRYLVESNPWVTLRRRCEMIREGLDTKKIAVCFAKRISVQGEDKIEIRVRNALTQPIEVISFSYEESTWDANQSLIKGNEMNKSNPHNPKSIIIPASFSHEPKVREGIFHFSPRVTGESNASDSNAYASIRILGRQQSPIINLLLVNEQILEAPLLPFFRPAMRDELPSFFVSKGDHLLIPTGNYQISNDIRIPEGRNLMIEKGTTIKFEKGTVLVSESAIYANGEPDEPILLTSAEDSWGGVLVSKSKDRSKWKHVRIENTTAIGQKVNQKGLDRNGWFCTGGVTFHQSEVDLLECSFVNSFAEDALNIISSNYSMLGCKFISNASDAFDGDFVTGRISDSQFHDIRGDAIDLSGSEVEINKILVENVLDKGISAGEGTFLKIENSEFRKIGFGIVSKDSSRISANNLRIEDAKISALAAYVKKENFGPAKISTTNTTIINSELDHLSQIKSSIELNGLLLESTHFDSKSLY